MEMEMEMGMQEGGAAAKAREGRLRKHAPASLQIDPRRRISAAGWERGPASRSPIPLLSPLVLPPPTLPDDTKRGLESEGDAGGNCEGPPLLMIETLKGGWCHPALPMVPMEPASLLPLFQSQCSVAHNDQSPPISGQVFMF